MAHDHRCDQRSETERKSPLEAVGACLFFLFELRDHSIRIGRQPLHFRVAARRALIPVTSAGRTTGRSTRETRLIRLATIVTALWTNATEEELKLSRSDTKHHAEYNHGSGGGGK